jgi:uncharacterized protein YndB with AHSA1/START domain
MSEPTTVEPITVERSVVLDAPAEDVWEALADPHELVEWLGVDGTLDLQPGGTGHVVDPDGTVRQVLITAVEPGHRLAWHWWPEGGDLSTVEIVTYPADHGTRVHVVETTIADPAPWRAQACATARSTAIDRHWQASLEALTVAVGDRRLVTLAAGPRW